eukprot:5525998-Amphidinium_carterae.1
MLRQVAFTRPKGSKSATDDKDKKSVEEKKYTSKCVDCGCVGHWRVLSPYGVLPRHVCRRVTVSTQTDPRYRDVAEILADLVSLGVLHSAADQALVALSRVGSERKQERVDSTYVDFDGASTCFVHMPVLGMERVERPATHSWKRCQDCQKILYRM